jgi:glycosyltransferase involved in cell wall biosynthesis
MAKIKKKPVVYDIFDFYGLSLPLKTPRFIRTIIKKLEDFFIEFVDMIILPDESRKRLLKTKKKVQIIYNSPEDEYKTQLQENNKFVLFYAGILTKTRGFFNIINAIENIDSVKLIIAGFGEDENELLKIFNNNKKINFIGKIRYEKVIEMTYKSDVLFALYDPSIPNNVFASPNKLFEAMMCGKPIIVNEGTSMTDIVRKENCGLVVSYGDIQALRKAILHLSNDPKLCKKLGANGRKAYEKKYSWKIMEKRLIESYETIA